MRRTYVYRGGELTEKVTRRRSGIEIMPDIEPVISPVDGTLLSSRSRVREHNRRNQVIDVGNDPSLWRGNPEPRQMNDPAQDIVRAWEELEHPDGAPFNRYRGIESGGFGD